MQNLWKIYSQFAFRDSDNVSAQVKILNLIVIGHVQSSVALKGSI